MHIRLGQCGAVGKFQMRQKHAIRHHIIELRHPAGPHLDAVAFHWRTAAHGPCLAVMPGKHAKGAVIGLHHLQPQREQRLTLLAREHALQTVMLGWIKANQLIGIRADHPVIDLGQTGLNPVQHPPPHPVKAGQIVARHRQDAGQRADFRNLGVGTVRHDHQMLGPHQPAIVAIPLRQRPVIAVNHRDCTNLHTHI